MAYVYRVLAVIHAVPGVGWTVATLAVLLDLRVQGELPMTPFGWRLGSPYPEIGTERLKPTAWHSRCRTRELGRARRVSWLAIATYSVPIEGRDEWVAAARRLA